MSIAEQDTSVTCEACEKQIDRSTIIAHLIFHVSREYAMKYGDNSEWSHDDDDQIHDLILSEYDDPDLRTANEVISNIVEKFKISRTVEVYKYEPFSNLLTFSERTGYIIHVGDHKIEKVGFDREKAISRFVSINNNLITKSLKDNYYTATITGTPTNTCQFVSYHVKVPMSWLGVPVDVKIVDDDKKNEQSIRTKPVKCGNSTHVTVPLAWCDSKVSVELALIDKKDVMVGSINELP